MTDPRISVIIPTRQRAELLRGSLESLACQSLPRDQYEVIVVDDGATDHTAEVCASLMPRMQLKHLRIEHSGISAAKNLGIFASSGPIVLFFDDDDYASPNLLAEHLAAHRRHSDERVAVLGYTTWAPALGVTDVMHYVMNVGRLLFCYTMSHGQTLDFTYFWGGRTSCKRRFLAQHGIFRHELRSILEDIELGYRLSKHGLKVIFHRNAIQYMNRPITYPEFCQRCERQGRAQYILSNLHADQSIQDYCGVASAERRWQQVQPELGICFYRVRELEAALASQPGIPTSPNVLAELHGLYKQTFEAMKLKGMVEAQSNSHSVIASHTRQPLVEPIVVYQMGKVGSKAVEAGLQRANLRNPIVHSHMLNNLDHIEQDIRRARPNPGDTLHQIQHGRQVVRTILGSNYVRCKVISLVRDPIARNLSAFFQNLTEFIPAAGELRESGELSAADVIAAFVESYNHQVPANWFQRQLQPVFGIDVFAQPFPHDQEYAIYRGDQADLLVIKLESLQKCAAWAMRDFLGLNNFELARVNVGEDKEYKQLYRDVLDRIRLPDEFVDHMYASQYATHFYSGHELDQFRRRWMRADVPLAVTH